ncbi:hypothetical protein OAQ81_01780 [Candidatus Thioglobus sp.]|nr:hypothetical protein [Candidatus Thioglobus sp.]
MSTSSYSIQEFFRYLCKYGDYLRHHGKEKFRQAALYLAWSNLFKMVAFFLPIKMLIVLASPETYAEYLPLIFSESMLIWGLGIFTPVAYMIYIGSGILFRISMDKDIAKQMIDMQAVNLPLAKKKQFYDSFLRQWSDIYLFGISVLMMVVYDYLFALIVVVTVFLVFLFFYRSLFEKSLDERYTLFQLDRSLLIEYIVSLSYLLVFVSLGIQVFYFDMDVLGAIYLLMLSRLSFSALQRCSTRGVKIRRLMPEVLERFETPSITK